MNAAYRDLRTLLAVYEWDTACHPSLNSTDLIEVADQALYAAKTIGRNRIYQAAPLAQPVTPTTPYR